MAHSGGSANEAEDEAPTNEGVAGRPGAQTVEVTGGDWSHAILGNPTIHKSKTIFHNIQGTPPIQATRDQVSQLAYQTYTSLTRGQMPGIEQPRVGDLLPGVRETSEQLSEDMSRLIEEGPLELKPKVQDQGSTKATSEQMSQVVIKALKKLELGESIPSASRVSRSSPAASGMAEELARTLSSYFEANHLKMTLTPLPVRNAICCFDPKSQFLRVYDPAQKTWMKKQKLQKDMMELAFTAAAINDDIYVLGQNQQVYRLTHSNTGSKWKPIAPMIFGHGVWPPVVIFNDNICVIGQCGGGSPSREAERYDPGLDTWSKITDMKTVKRDQKLAATKGHIYCIGGYDGNEALTSVERLDPGDQSWSDVAPMKTARAGAASAVLESKIFILGGWNSGRRVSDVECYDPDTNTWTSVVNMRIERSWFSAVVVDGKIFAVGGDGPYRVDSPKSIEMFDPEKKQWEVVEEVDNMRIYSPAAVAIKM